MHSRPKLLLAGTRLEELRNLADSLQNAGVDASYIHLDDLNDLGGYCILLVDIDGNQGLTLARRLARNSRIEVATLSESDREADNVMHIIKPMGYIDLQILLIRAGLITF